MRRVRVDFGIEIFESSCRITSPDGLRLNTSLIAKSFDAFASLKRFAAPASRLERY
jgi:hypothetical protein